MKNLKFGEKGEAVAQMQRALIEKGYQIAETAEFDAATENALTEYQNAQNLLADGIFGKDSRAALYGMESTGKYLKESDVRQAAEILGTDVATIKAVIRVESAGSGYLKDGRVLILFERHIFNRLLDKKNPAAATRARGEAPHICNPKSGGYIGRTGEYPRLARAMSIDGEIGMMSASWGLFQIMGFNYAEAGFASIHEFVDAMKESEGKQLQAFAHFVKANKTMHAALKKQDWATFAKLYNGPAYAKNNYDKKLASAHSRYAANAAAAA